MRLWLPALFALTVAAPGAEDADEKKTAVSDLLPDGSQLHGVVIPRHNDEYQLVNSLIADVVTLVNEEMVSGERVTIDFYNRKGLRSARIKLKQAEFTQSTGMLHATETVTVDAERYKARGNGLHYAMRSGRGLLLGPAVTWMENPPQTAMKSKTPSLIGAAGVALVAQTGAVADAQTASDKSKPVQVNTVADHPVSKAQKEAEAQLKDAIDASSTTDAEVKKFIDDSSLEYEKITGNKATPADSGPLDFKPGPDHTVINCEGGMYFDPDKGQLVYLQKVKVTDPQYILTGADVLRVYMAKKPEEKPKPGKDTPKDKPKPKNDKDEGPVPSLGGNFDSVEKIVATGAVRILQKQVEKGKQPVEASGALFTYHPETGDILLSGGYPWVKQGDFFARAKEPNLTLRMKKDGSFVTQGNWEMGGRLNQR